MKTYDVAIIGAGTAGLTARKEVAKQTDNYVVIDDGPLGTTCARVGCMPSKVLIQVANDFERRNVIGEEGIEGAEKLTLNRAQALKHVRKLRDRFVKAVKNPMEGWEDKLIRKRATFIDSHTLDLGDEQIAAEKIILAPGSRPNIPGPWRDYREHLVTTDELFEMEEPPQKMAVIGLGVIGLELGQALARLGIDIVGIGRGKEMGGITDPTIQKDIVKNLQKEMPLYFSGAKLSGLDERNRLIVKAGETEKNHFHVDKALVAVGRRSNVDRLGLEKLNLEMKKGLPNFDRGTLQLEGCPHIFMAGDVTNERPILHEASDEGFIAGHNSVHDPYCFRRRELFSITFTDPNISLVGRRYSDLINEKIDFVEGKVSFEGQGRSIVKLKEKGMLKIYAKRQGGEILGAELFAPDGEHLGHLLSWGLSMKLTVEEMLKMPFYHPVVEEGLRTALRDARSQLDGTSEIDLLRCDDTPIR